MEENEIPDLNVFMMCEKINKDAYKELPAGYKIRKLKRTELKLWFGFPFDEPKDKVAYLGFMQTFYDNVYKKREDEFFNRCLVVCNKENKPIGTCFAWKAYEKFWTIHWYKINKECENKGLGRALLTEVMKSVPENELPIYLHTQPGSFRAIKIYSDFGFKILKDKEIGNRANNIKHAKKYLKYFMKDYYKDIKFAKSNGELSRVSKMYSYNEF